jgi:hypothetical protein
MISFFNLARLAAAVGPTQSRLHGPALRVPKSADRQDVKEPPVDPVVSRPTYVPSEPNTDSTEKEKEATQSPLPAQTHNAYLRQPHRIT